MPSTRKKLPGGPAASATKTSPKLEGNSLRLGPGADPIRGQTIPGRTVSPSS